MWRNVFSRNRAASSPVLVFRTEAERSSEKLSSLALPTTMVNLTLDQLEADYRGK